MNRSVLFILSTNYAGSHFASLMIGSHSKAVHVGEVCHLRKERFGKAICSRCGSFDRCPLFRDIRPRTIDRAYDVLFAATPPQTSILVDNSKKPQWAERFLGHPTFQKKFIHLIRDPRALVRRWDLAYTTPESIRKLRRRWFFRDPSFRWFGSSPRRLYLYKWLAQNERITRLLRKRRLDHLLVTYRDLALDTEAELQRIMTFLGLPFEPGQIEYWNVDHHGSQKEAYEWVKSEKARLFDTRWKEHLTADEQRDFAQDPLVLRYLEALGIRITPDGLTRAPETSKENS